MSIAENQKEESVFVELMPLLKQRTLLITVARVEEKLKVNVIPARAKEEEDQALTTPLSFAGSPEELDAERGSDPQPFAETASARRFVPVLAAERFWRCEAGQAIR